MCIDDVAHRAGNEGADDDGYRHLLHYLRPDSRLILTHMFYDPNEDPPTVSALSRNISLPPVYGVLIEYTDYLSECACSPESRLEHTSPRLKLVEIESRDRFCPLAVTALNPTVEKLTPVVTNHHCVSAYIEDVKHSKLHPNLSVTVRYFDTTAMIEEGDLRRKLASTQGYQAVWSETLGVPVEVDARPAPLSGKWW